MKKMVFLKKKEFEGILSEGMSKLNGSPTSCSVIIDEEKYDECVKSISNDVIEILYIEELFDILEKNFKTKIISYDVMEIGDYGDGFVFFIE